LPAASTKYLDPVTHPAAPKKVSFAIAQHSTPWRIPDKACMGGFLYL
jgi:hypothetical protein